jgi:hypothetical protein
VDAEVAANPFTLSNTDSFADAARGRIPADEAAPPAVDSTKASEDYAAKVRDRATAPPPPK